MQLHHHAADLANGAIKAHLDVIAIRAAEPIDEVPLYKGADRAAGNGPVRGDIEMLSGVEKNVGASGNGTALRYGATARRYGTALRYGATVLTLPCITVNFKI